MTIKIVGDNKMKYTELYDSTGRLLCAVAGKYSLKRMIRHWSGGRKIV